MKTFENLKKIAKEDNVIINLENIRGGEAEAGAGHYSSTFSSNSSDETPCDGTIVCRPCHDIVIIEDGN